MSYLLEKYQKEIAPLLKKEFGFKNIFQIPKIEKVIVNVGIGRFITQNPQRKDHILKEAVDIVSKITGQKPLLASARQSISSFKLREGMTVGLKVTLHGKRAYDFLSRLLGAALPRSRDFQGLNKKSVGPTGALDIGIREHIAFPEVAQLQTSLLYGLQVTVVPSTKKRDIAMRFYELLGFPFKED